MKKENLILTVITVIAILFILELSLRCGIVKNAYYDAMAPARESNIQKYRILLLGDSYGRNIHRFLLDQLKPFGVNLLNTSVSGFGPFEYERQMENIGIPFRPDITVLCYFVGNDFSNVKNSNLNKTGLKNHLLSMMKKLLYKTYIYYYYVQKKNLLFPHFFNYKKYAARGISQDYINLAKKGKINPWTLELSLKNNNFLLENIMMQDKDALKTWETTKLLLSRIQRLSQKSGSYFVIVIFPSTAQINKSKYDFFKSLRLNVDDRMLYSDKPQRLLNDFCRTRQIPCLDLLPCFKAEQKTELYRTDDDHLNDAGNKLASKAIVEFLKSNAGLK